MNLSADYLKNLVEESKQVMDSPGLESIVQNQEDESLKSPGVEAHYYRFLYRLARDMKASVMVELGTHTGISSACLAEGSASGEVLTVNCHDQLWSHCRRWNVRYILQDSLTLIDLPGAIDILFIDTDHDGIRCIQEFGMYEKFLAKDCVVLFDDIFLNKEMKDFWENFSPNGWEKVELAAHGEAGFGALIRK